MPKHHFKIVPYTKNLTYKEVSIDKKISIDDHFILYIFDSLEWVPSRWIRISNKKKGLDYYGITFFVAKEIDSFKAILMSWYALVQNAPDKFKLARSLFPEDWFYKEQILGELENVIALCEQANKEKKVLVHFGI
ncbi:hypothetical protein ACYSNW_16245 [Enterococcus sp. LJL99]